MGTSSSRADGVAPRGGAWTRAKRQVTSFTRDTGASAGSAVGAFAGAVASRGHQRQARGVGWSPSVRSGQALGGLLSNIASEGLDQALGSRGLAHLVGASSTEVLSAIVDYVAGDGSLIDDIVARSATVEVLAAVFGDSDDSYAELRDRWETELDAESVIQLIALFLSQVVFQRFLVEMGERIETNAVSLADVEQKEQEVLDFIQAMVTLELGMVDPISFAWEGPEGQELLARNLAAALAQLEAYA